MQLPCQLRCPGEEHLASIAALCSGSRHRHKTPISRVSCCLCFFLFSTIMWAAAIAVVLLLAVRVSAVEFETATVDGYFNYTSQWEGGFCGSLM